MTALCLLLSLACCGLRSAATAQETIAGRWEGEIELPGQRLAVGIVFRLIDGSWDGAMDVGSLTGVALHEVTQEGPSVHFEMGVTQVTAIFDGHVEGDEMSGKVLQEGEGTFVLRRAREVDLDEPIRALMEEKHIPGLAAAAIRDGEVVWVGTYGFENLAEQRPVTEETLFLLASVSKTITATALMQLHSEGRFDLDDDVSDYLPFTVRNPGFADLPITFAQLLRHRSSIRDNMAFYGPLWSAARGDSDTVLGQYLASYLVEGGEHFDREDNFFPERPGTEFRYCNTCYALLGYLAEVISGQPFEDHSAEVLFAPLEMTQTGWFYSDVDSSRVALGYRYDEDEGHVPVGPVGYPDWPAGQLRSSLTELARFLAAYTGFGLFDGAQVIDSTTVELMAPRHQAVGFYTWFGSSFPVTGSVLYTHGGGDLGARTLIGFDPATRNGFVVLTNGEASIDDIAALILEATPTLGW